MNSEGIQFYSVCSIHATATHPKYGALGLCINIKCMNLDI